MDRLSRRIESFPPDLEFKQAANMIAREGNDGCQYSTVKRLAEEGHFYSHVRLTKEETTCYACGMVTKWEDNEVGYMQSHYEDQCSHFATNVSSSNEDEEYSQAEEILPRWTIALDGVASTTIKAIGLSLLWRFQSNLKWDIQAWNAGKCHGKVISNPTTVTRFPHFYNISRGNPLVHLHQSPLSIGTLHSDLLLRHHNILDSWQRILH